MADPVLSLGSYALGVLWIAVVTGSVTVGAWRLRRALLPDWCALAAGVVIAVTALTALLVVAEVLGGLGLLRWAPMVVVTAAVGTAMVVLAHWLEGRVAGSRGPELLPSPAPLRAAAAIAVAGIAAQWATHTADALSRGMTHADTLWYHGPYSAHFLQTGALGDVGTLGQEQTRFYPLSSELLHTLVAMPFDRDVLSPLVNLGFGGLALAAAALLGAHFGVGALGVLGCTLVLGLPTLAGTQPGQGSSDVMGAALLLAAVALVVKVRLDVAPLMVAGAALGLAVGTKLSILAPATVLAVLILVRCLRAGRRMAALGWTVAVTGGGIAWAARNIAIAHHPLPFFDVDLGPLQLTAVAPPNGAASLVGSLDQLDVWRSWYSGGLTAGFGRLWPVVVAACLLGVCLAFARGSGSIRAVALSAAAGLAAYPFTPYTGESSFQYNLRIAAPTMLVASVLLAVSVARWPRVHLPLGGALLALVLVNLTAPHHERVDAWPGHPGAAAAAVVAVAAGSALIAHPPGWRPRGAGMVLVVLSGLVVGGFPLQTRYLEHRYADAGLADSALDARFRTITGARVDVLGTPEVYPFFGADLSNEVTDHSARLNTIEGAAIDAALCTTWRAILSPGDRLVVLSRFGFLLRPFTLAERHAVFESDPAVTALLDDGDRAIYRVDGDLDPSACPPEG